MSMNQYDEEDFNDFLSKVNSIDDAVKGLKNNTITVDDVDKQYAHLLEETPKKTVTKATRGRRIEEETGRKCET